MGLAQSAKVVNAKIVKTDKFLSVLFLLEKSDFQNSHKVLLKMCLN